VALLRARKHRASSFWTPKEESQGTDGAEKLAKVFTGEKSSNLAGVAEWVDAVDLKSKNSKSRKRPREPKRRS